MDTGSLKKVRAKMVMLTSQWPSSVKMKGHCSSVGSVNMCDNSGSYSQFVPKLNSQDIVEYVIFFLSLIPEWVIGPEWEDIYYKPHFSRKKSFTAHWCVSEVSAGWKEPLKDNRPEKSELQRKMSQN